MAWRAEIEDTESLPKGRGLLLEDGKETGYDKGRRTLFREAIGSSQKVLKSSLK